MSDIELGRAIDGNETKTFQCKGVVLHLDDNVPGERYEGATVGFVNPVKVVDEDNKLLGWATLHQEGKVLEADYFLEYHCPQRLDIETEGGAPWWPHLGAFEAMDTSAPPWRIAHSEITEICLTQSPNVDARIDPL